jgi:hypothetical protein
MKTIHLPLFFNYSIVKNEKMGEVKKLLKFLIILGLGFVDCGLGFGIGLRCVSPPVMHHNVAARQICKLWRKICKLWLIVHGF